MINIISANGGKAVNGVSGYLVDSLTDLNTVPEYCAPGSTAYCVENKKTYMLNGSREWVAIETSGGGGGGGEPAELNVFIAEFGVTAWQEITDAVRAKKEVVCYYDNTAGGGSYHDKVCYTYDGQDSIKGDHYFHVLNSGSSLIKRVVLCRRAPEDGETLWDYREYDLQNVLAVKIGTTSFATVKEAYDNHKMIIGYDDAGKQYDFFGLISNSFYFCALGAADSATKTTYTLSESAGWSTASTNFYLLSNAAPADLDESKNYVVTKLDDNRIQLVDQDISLDTKLEGYLKNENHLNFVDTDNNTITMAPDNFSASYTNEDGDYRNLIFNGLNARIMKGTHNGSADFNLTSAGDIHLASYNGVEDESTFLDVKDTGIYYTSNHMDEHGEYISEEFKLEPNDNWVQIADISVASDVSTITIAKDLNNKDFDLKKFYMIISYPAGAASDINRNIILNDNTTYPLCSVCCGDTNYGYSLVFFELFNKSGHYEDSMRLINGYCASKIQDRTQANLQSLAGGLMLPGLVSDDNPMGEWEYIGRANSVKKITISGFSGTIKAQTRIVVLGVKE